MQALPIRVCYLNITPGDFSRSGVHMRSLELRGAQVLPCIDSSPGMRKFWEIFKKHRALRGKYDVIIVGYPAYILVPFARLISRKPVIFDAGWSLYEGTVVTRKLYEHQPLKRLYLWVIDSLAYHSADLVLLESEQQIEYYTRLLRVGRTKCRRLFTGADESRFYFDPAIKKRDTFTVLFRGYTNIDDGSEHVLAAARVLQDEGVRFLIISPNFRLKKDLPPNVELREGFFDIATLRAWMQECHVSIGHVSTNERLDRTIPHKAFESMLLRIPFMISDGAGVRELFSGDSAVLVKSVSEADIVKQIRKLKNDPARCVRLADNAFAIYKEKCSNAVLGEELMSYIRPVLE